ncbi:hypothetical protein Tco_1118013, partial [Tanacetum coccineum]
ETILPNAFNAVTLQDPSLENWNMDTCASSHLNDSISSLSDVFNLCIYPSVSVGDRNSIPFDAFDFSVKDFLTRRVLLRCDSTGDLYPVMKPSIIPHAFLTSQYTSHQRLGHPRSEVLRRVLSSNSISYNKETSPILSCLSAWQAREDSIY